MVKRRKLSQVEALEAEQLAGRIPVRLVGVDVQASLQLALTHNIYAYDAYFLQQR
jgi:predicted nucleic acid-binding protein